MDQNIFNGNTVCLLTKPIPETTTNNHMENLKYISPQSLSPNCKYNKSRYETIYELPDEVDDIITQGHYQPKKVENYQNPLHIIETITKSDSDINSNVDSDCDSNSDCECEGFSNSDSDNSMFMNINSTLIFVIIIFSSIVMYLLYKKNVCKNVINSSDDNKEGGVIHYTYEVDSENTNILGYKPTSCKIKK